MSWAGKKCRMDPVSQSWVTVCTHLWYSHLCNYNDVRWCKIIKIIITFFHLPWDQYHLYIFINQKEPLHFCPLCIQFLFIFHFISVHIYSSCISTLNKHYLAMGKSNDHISNGPWDCRGWSEQQDETGGPGVTNDLWT